MAATEITLNKMKRGEALSLPVSSAVDATNGAYIDFSGDDGRILIIMENSDSSNAETVTVKAGDGIQATGDLSITLTASQKALVNIESGPYKIMSGTNKNKVKVSASADVKLAAVLLP